jgi:hypothetical protein
MAQRRHHWRSALLLSASLTAGWRSGSSAEAQLYRWIDDSGAVHYSDRLPPTQVEQGHTTLNREGVRTEIVAPAPTAEELKRVEELERAQAAAAQQAERDRRAALELLQRFRSVEDLLLTRDGKIAAIDALGQTTRDNIRQALQKRRALHQQQTAPRTPKDPPLPLSFAADVAQVEQQIRSGYTTIVTQEFQKAAIYSEYRQMQLRYNALKDKESASTPLPPPPIVQADNLVRCTSSATCQRRWEQALAYVQALPNLRDTITGQGLLLAVQQDEREERQWTLVWIQLPTDAAVSLYLDLNCKNRRTASLICTNQAALQARDGFRKALE